MAISYSTSVDIRGKAADPVVTELLFENKTIADNLVDFNDGINTFIAKLYGKQAENLINYGELTLYEPGDFTLMHRDGQNPGRLCAVLVYFSKEYNESYGGQLLLKHNNKYIEVLPVYGNYVILDFTRHNIEHGVNQVRNGFKRMAYLSFVREKQ